MVDRLFSPREAADYLGVTISGLNRWRMSGGGPRYLKLSRGPRGRVRYREEDLHAFIESRLRGEMAHHV